MQQKHFFSIEFRILPTINEFHRFLLYFTTDHIQPPTRDHPPTSLAASPAAGRRQAGTLRADFPARVSRISTYMALAQNSWPVWNSTGSLLT